jgi:hypothetical protein
MRDVCALRHFSINTEKSYIHWLGRYASFLMEPSASIRVNKGHLGRANLIRLCLTQVHSQSMLISNGHCRFMDLMISKLRVWPIWKELKHFAVSAACEDSPTSTRADEFCRGLSRELAPKCTLAKEIWLFNQLGVPQLRAIAASEAALAQLIIISVHHAESLPDGVRSWIDLWLGQRNNHNIVLLALFDPVYQGVSGTMKAYLAGVAKKGGIEFLVKSEE